MRLYNNKKYESLPDHQEDCTLLENKSEIKEVYNFWQTQRCGFVVLLISSFGYAGSAICVSLAGDLPTPMIVWSRYTATFICSGLLGFVWKIEMMAAIEDKKVLLLRSIFGVSSVAIGTYAFQTLPVGQASVMISASPVCVAILSTCFLGDKLSVKTGVLIIMCMAGVVMVVDPSALSSDTTVGQVSASALIAAMLTPLVKGLVYIFIKKSNGAKMHYIKLSVWYSTFGMTVTTVYIVGMFAILDLAEKPYDSVIRSINASECTYVFGVAFLGAIAQVSMTKATQIINTTVASLIRNGDIIFTILFQVLYYKEIPSLIQVAGIITMVLSTVGVILVKERRRIEAEKNAGKEHEEKSGHVDNDIMALKSLLKDEEKDLSCDFTSRSQEENTQESAVTGEAV